MAVVRSEGFNQKLCEILGLDPKIVQGVKITIEAEPGDLVHITVNMLGTVETTERLLDEVKKYRLQEIK